MYQRLLDLSLEGLLRVDAEDRITYANARMAEMVGWGPGELEGRPVYDLLFPEDAGRARERRAERRQGEREQYEVRLRHRGGGACWVIAGVSILEENGAYTGTFSLMTDITERRRAEEALRRSEQDLQLALGAARLGTFYCEWPFDKILWNEACMGHFFLPPGTEVDFTLFYSLLHPDDRERTRAAIDRAIEERVEYNVEYRAQAPDGRTRWINAVGRGRYDEAGVPVRFDGITMDITGRKESERELAASFERERLVNRISQAIRAAEEPEAVLEIAVASLGHALDVDHCYFVTYDMARGSSVIGPEWHRAGRAALAGEYDAFRYSYNRDAAYLAGQTYAVEDSLALPGPGPSGADDRGHLRALVRVPLSPGPHMTALGVAMVDTPRRWTPNEVMLVEAIASQAQAARESARLRQRERRIADALQAALQPAIPAHVPGLALGAFSKPALDEARVGGDFYDVFALDKELYAVVIGDVSGKGLAAAAQLATVRNMLRGVLYQYRAPARALTGLNTIVTAHDLIQGFVTLFAGLYDVRTGEIVYASCGHEPGLVHRAAGGQTARLEPTGPPLGVWENSAYAEGRVTLAPGDTLLLHTDGLSEAGPTRLDLLGTEGLIRALRAHAGEPDAQEAAARIVAEADAHAQGVFRDDVCVLLLRRL